VNYKISLKKEKNKKEVKKMSEVKEQHKPTMEKATQILDALDDLDKSIDDLTVELTPYLLPTINGEIKKEKAVEGAQEAVSPLEEYLKESLDKINYLKMKIKQINSRIR